MYLSQTYLDHMQMAEKSSAPGSRGWGSIHRAYALAVLAVGGVASYQVKDMNLAIAVAVLVATWAIIFQLIATTKLLHRSLMMIHASQERRALKELSPAPEHR